MARDYIQFRRNGRTVRVKDFPPRTTLLDWLRLDQRQTGTKEGCAEGDCGACTVVLARERDGRLAHDPINSCIFLLGQLDGAELITVDDLAEGGALHPVQKALAAGHGSQCGFCTPGIVMSVFANYHAHQGSVDRDEINDVLAGNLCRCTGYRPIVDAAREACSSAAADRYAREAAPRREALAQLRDAQDVMVGSSARFFAAPASEDALAALYEAHPDATLIGGATDVGLWITKKLAAIEKIIHVGRVRGLDEMTQTRDVVRFGAAAPLASAAPFFAAIDPDAAEILRRFGSVQVRAAGTVGGSIANGSPIGDLAPMFIALGAEVEMRHGARVRTLPLEDFFVAYGKQDRAPGEFVRALIVRKPASNSHFRAFKISKRPDEDISAVMGAFNVTLAQGRISAARIAYGGMAATPKRARAAEAALSGAAVNDVAAWHAAAAALAQDFTPLSDARASAAYRLRVAQNLLMKALAEISGAPPAATRLVSRREPAHAAS